MQGVRRRCVAALPHEEYNEADAPISTQHEPNELYQSFPNNRNVQKIALINLLFYASKWRVW
jgi:hypothetical protein